MSHVRDYDDTHDAAVLHAAFSGFRPRSRQDSCAASCRAPVDAVLQARAKVWRPASDIECIRVGVTAPRYQMVCVPEQIRLAPHTIAEAQFSIPYTVAASWIE
jgi:2-methylcitrate dehydratase PrpD